MSNENDATEDLLLQPDAGRIRDEFDNDDQIQDFRALRAIISNTAGRSKQVQLPKRGEKAAELDSTAKQASMIDNSRRDAHEVLSYQRTHIAKNRIYGLYDPNTNGVWVLRSKGNLFNTLGKWRKRETTTVDVSEDAIPLILDTDENSDEDYGLSAVPSILSGAHAEKTLRGGLWLYPEEAIYMLERGSLDIRITLALDFDLTWSAMEKDRIDIVDAITEPMSLQAAYVFFLSRPAAQSQTNSNSIPHITFEMYQVYAHLKRLGYQALRAVQLPPTEDAVDSKKSLGLTHPKPGLPSLFPVFRPKDSELSNPTVNIAHSSEASVLGPICQPGLYRSYCDVFAQIKLIPFHDPRGKSDTASIPYFLSPSLIAPTPPSPDDVASPILTRSGSGASKPDTPPLAPTFNVYKPSTHYSKRSEIPPDFRIAVIPSRLNRTSNSASPLDYPELSSLLASTPTNPPAPPNIRKQAYSLKKSPTLSKKLYETWRWASQFPTWCLCTLIPPLQKHLTYSNTSAPDPRSYYQKLKHGHQTVIIAIVDNGIISFLQFSDAAFGLTDVDWRYFQPKATGERGGGRGRGGRGRGRGGRGRGRKQ